MSDTSFVLRVQSPWAYVYLLCGIYLFVCRRGKDWNRNGPLKAKPWGWELWNQTCTISSPLFKSPSQAYLLEQASLNYFLYHLASSAETRSSSILPKTLGWVEPIFIHFLSYTAPSLIHLPFSSSSSSSSSFSPLHPVSTLFQISPGRQLHHVTGALVITEVGNRAHPRGRVENTLKITVSVKRHKVSAELCGSGWQRLPNTLFFRISLPVFLIEAVSGAAGQPLDLLLPTPPFSCSCLSHWLALLPQFTSPCSPIFNVLFFFFSPCLASGLQELYLISFCWVN